MPSPHGLAIVDRCVVCALRRESFFCSLPAAVLQEFEKLKISTLFCKGTFLFVEGRTPQGIHMLCQGEVKLSTSLRDGRTMVLKLAQPGEILGLSSCISGSPSRRPHAMPGTGPCFLVAPSAQIYGLARMFQSYGSETHPEVHVVRSMDEAYTFLGVYEPRFEPLIGNGAISKKPVPFLVRRAKV